MLVALVVTIVLAGAGALAINLIDELRTTQARVIYERATELRNTEALGLAIFTRSSNARGYLLTGQQHFLEARAAARDQIQERLPRVLAAARGDVARNVQSINALYDRLDVASDRAIAAFRDTPELAREQWTREVSPIQNQIENEFAQVLATQRTAFDAARDEADADSARALRILIGLIVAIVGVIATLIYAYARVTRTLLAKQRAEQRMTTFRLLEQVPVGVFVTTADGKPYYANKHAKKLLGRGIERVKGGLAATYRAYEAGTDRPYPENRLPIVRALGGESAEVTDLEIHRGEEVIPLHIVAAPVYDANDRLAFAVSGFQDVRELQRVAMRDSLTGLSNRAAVQQQFQREALLAQRMKRSLALALIDLDHFKSINDTHGHAAGDDVLRRIASVICETLRRSDIVGRWGGEELIVMMPDTDIKAATRALERSLEATRAQTFTGKDNALFRVTFSAGVIIVGADEKLDIAVSRADKLLYAAKEAGRDRVLTAVA